MGHEFMEVKNSPAAIGAAGGGGQWQVSATALACAQGCWGPVSHPRATGPPPSRAPAASAPCRRRGVSPRCGAQPTRLPGLVRAGEWGEGGLGRAALGGSPQTHVPLPPPIPAPGSSLRAATHALLRPLLLPEGRGAAAGRWAHVVRCGSGGLDGVCGQEGRAGGGGACRCSPARHASPRPPPAQPHASPRPPPAPAQCYAHEAVGLSDAAIRAYGRAVGLHDPDGIALHKLVGAWGRRSVQAAWRGPSSREGQLITSHADCPPHRPSCTRRAATAQRLRGYTAPACRACRWGRWGLRGCRGCEGARPVRRKRGCPLIRAGPGPRRAAQPGRD
jgi:hypothetical protein